MFKINIMTQLLIFFILAISINFMTLNVLISLFIFFAVALVFTKNNQFLRTIFRLKWFFLVMLLIFAFNTPGEYVSSWPFAISPSYEGILAGLTQTLRMMTMLASLGLVLACNTRQQLISGFYFIFSPLKYLGLKVERFAARLWLTLHYVEQQDELQNKQNFISQLKNMTDIKSDHTNENISITFVVPSFNFADYAAITLAITTSLSLMYSRL